MRARLAGRRGLVIGLFAAAAFAIGATAYWSGVGLGSTSTRLADTKSLVLSAGTPTAQLYPGGSASVSVVASNPNPYVVHIGSLVLDTSAGTGGFDVDVLHSSCAVGPLGFTAQDHAGKGWSVPPKTGGTDGTLPIDMAASLTMSVGAANACQGAVFTVHLEGRS